MRAKADWFILAVYWAISGYGLRAWRAFATLFAVLCLGTWELLLRRVHAPGARPAGVGAETFVFALEVGLPKIRLHDVRHSYATAALRAGMSVKVLSQRLGHADISVTLRVYAHVLPGDDETAAALVAAAITGTLTTLGDRDGSTWGAGNP